MNRRRTLAIGAAVTAVIVIAAAGYVLGANAAPDGHDAALARNGAEQAAFSEASLAARKARVGKGRKAGVGAGRRQGAVKGSRTGTLAGRSDVHAKVHTLRLAAAKRSESESEIGGIDSFDGTAPATPLAGSGGVLVVGDSLEVLTIPYLKQYLPGVHLTTDAVGGYNSFQIFDLFKQSYDPSQSVIVFDSGTNDNPNYPQILAARLNAVAGEIGNRCMVVPTIHGLTVGGVGNAGKNQTVGAFVASRPGTQSPDWAGAVAAHPELMQSDNLHPTAQGADLRARLIAQGVKRCLRYG